MGTATDSPDNMQTFFDQGEREFTARQKQQIFTSEVCPHKSALLGVATRLTKNKHDAEDLVQDTLCRAFVHLDKYEPGTNCKAWLFRILTNTFLNRHKKNKQDKRLSETITHGLLSERFDNASPEHSSEIKAQLSLIKKILKQLPEDLRNVVWLVDVHDFDFRETSAVLGLPVGAVMSSLYRGRRLLKTTYSHQSFDLP